MHFTSGPWADLLYYFTFVASSCYTCFCFTLFLRFVLLLLLFYMCFPFLLVLNFTFLFLLVLLFWPFLLSLFLLFLLLGHWLQKLAFYLFTCGPLAPEEQRF